MRRAVRIVVLLIGLAALYLLAWPVPVDPVAWNPPADEGLTGAYTPNDILAAARAVDLQGYSGPEALARGRNGRLYASVAEGAILEIPRHGGKPRVFAETGGRPLGLATLPDGALAVANATLGLQRVAPDGTVTMLANEAEGRALVSVNDVAAARDGRLFFTESSAKFGAAAYGGTLEGSLLDILEHGGHGRLLVYEPDTREVRVLLEGLDYANGVAISEDQQFLLLAETGTYRIVKFWVAGERAGQREILLDNLPGFPDNVDNGLNGRFWIGLVAPRNALLDRFAPRPFVRKMLQRLPGFVRPKPVRASHVIAVSGDGQVLMNLQDPAARYPMLTGALELSDRLYLPTLAGAYLPYIDKQDLL